MQSNSSVPFGAFFNSGPIPNAKKYLLFPTDEKIFTKIDLEK